MIRAVFAIPGDLMTPTGGYAYDRHVMRALPACGIEVGHLQLPDGFPFPSADALDETGRLLAAVPADLVLIIDGLALGALPRELLARVGAPIIAMHHHPLGLETGLTRQQAQELLASEKVATSFARRVIVTSQITAETLTELGFAPPPPVTVAIPGLVRAERSRGSGSDQIEIVCVGTVVPRKGYDILVAALAQISDEPWHCTIVGDLDRDLQCVKALRTQVARTGLEERIHFAGALESAAVSALYGRADLFALASRYEGYGMAFAEAMAHGLPVLATRAPAIPATVPPEAGILVEPDNVGDLAEALCLLIRDADLRQRLGTGAWAHAQSLPSWKDTAAIIAGVIREVADGRLLG